MNCPLVNKNRLIIYDRMLPGSQPEEYDKVIVFVIHNVDGDDVSYELAYDADKTIGEVFNHFQKNIKDKNIDLTLI